MDSHTTLWDDLRDLFSEERGSLPEIRVVNIPPADLGSVFGVVLGLAPCQGAATEMVWNHQQGLEVPVAVPPDIATRIATGSRRSTRIDLRGLQAGGVALPDLGAFVAADEIALDFRPGPAWGPAAVTALVGVIGEMLRVCSSASIDVAPWAGAGIRDRVRAAITAHLNADLQASIVGHTWRTADSA